MEKNSVINTAESTGGPRGTICSPIMVRSRLDTHMVGTPEGTIFSDAMLAPSPASRRSSVLEITADDLADTNEKSPEQFSDNNDHNKEMSPWPSRREVLIGEGNLSGSSDFENDEDSSQTARRLSSFSTDSEPIRDEENDRGSVGKESSEQHTKISPILPLRYPSRVLELSSDSSDYDHADDDEPERQSELSNDLSTESSLHSKAEFESIDINSSEALPVDTAIAQTLQLPAASDTPPSGNGDWVSSMDVSDETSSDDSEGSSRDTVGRAAHISPECATCQPLKNHRMSRGESPTSGQQFKSVNMDTGVSQVGVTVSRNYDDSSGDGALQSQTPVADEVEANSEVVKVKSTSMSYGDILQLISAANATLSVSPVKADIIPAASICSADDGHVEKKCVKINRDALRKNLVHLKGKVAAMKREKDSLKRYLSQVEDMSATISEYRTLFGGGIGEGVSMSGTPLSNITMLPQSDLSVSTPDSPQREPPSGSSHDLDLIVQDTSVDSPASGTKRAHSTSAERMLPINSPPSTHSSPHVSGSPQPSRGSERMMPTKSKSFAVRNAFSPPPTVDAIVSTTDNDTASDLALHVVTDDRRDGTVILTMSASPAKVDRTDILRKARSFTTRSSTHRHHQRHHHSDRAAHSPTKEGEGWPIPPLSPPPPVSGSPQPSRGSERTMPTKSKSFAVRNAFSPPPTVDAIVSTTDNDTASDLALHVVTDDRRDGTVILTMSASPAKVDRTDMLRKARSLTTRSSTHRHHQRHHHSEHSKHSSEVAASVVATVDSPELSKSPDSQSHLIHIKKARSDVSRPCVQSLGELSLEPQVHVPLPPTPKYSEKQGKECSMFPAAMLVNKHDATQLEVDADFPVEELVGCGSVQHNKDHPDAIIEKVHSWSDSCCSNGEYHEDVNGSTVGVQEEYTTPFSETENADVTGGRAVLRTGLSSLSTFSSSTQDVRACVECYQGSKGTRTMHRVNSISASDAVDNAEINVVSSDFDFDAFSQSSSESSSFRRSGVKTTTDMEGQLGHDSCGHSDIRATYEMIDVHPHGLSLNDIQPDRSSTVSMNGGSTIETRNASLEGGREGSGTVYPPNGDEFLDNGQESPSARRRDMPSPLLTNVTRTRASPSPQHRVLVVGDAGKHVFFISIQVFIVCEGIEKEGFSSDAISFFSPFLSVYDKEHGCGYITTGSGSIYPDDNELRRTERRCLLWAVFQCYEKSDQLISTQLRCVLCSIVTIWFNWMSV